MTGNNKNMHANLPGKTIPRTMSLGAILLESQQDLVMEEFDLPDTLFEGQVLLSMISASICATQLREIQAPDGPDLFLPHLLGHEGFAKVDATGPGVSKVNIGDHVVVHWREGSGMSGGMPVYSWNGAKLNAGPVAVFATKIITIENRVTRVPKDLNPDIAPLLGCALTTGWGVVTKELEFLSSDKKILVLGVGGIGAAILASAKASEFNSLYMVENNLENIQVGLSLGANVFSLRNDNLRERFAAIIDTTGNVELIETALKLLEPTGTLVLVGMSHGDRGITLDVNYLLKGRKVLGSNGGSANPTLDIPEILGAMESGQLAVENLKIHRMLFSEINAALDRIRAGEGGRFTLIF